MLLAAGFLLFVLAVQQSCATVGRTRYDGYKVYSVVPVEQSTLDLLHRLLIENPHIDFWEEPSRLGHEVTFMVGPDHQTVVELTLNAAGIEFTVKTDDVERTLLTPTWNELNRRSRTRLGFNLTNFNNLDTIYTWLQSLASQCRQGFKCKLYSIGSSFEGRPIYVFRIIKKVPNRKAFWLDATIHAREWITTATIVNVMDAMLKGSNAEAVRLTDTYDWYFLPVLNPDGYAYTWSKNRMWRKNRRPTSSQCYGVDLNRNFDYHWAADGVSHNPCSEIFCGPSGGSEPETRAVQAELVRLGPTLLATVTMHSYGYMWMFPWGNTVTQNGQQVCERAADHNDLMRVADAAANAIERTYNTHWERGNSCEVIYATTGGTDDYAKGVAGVKYAFCPELRGNNFIIDASQIPLSAREFWNGVVAMCDAIRSA